MHLAHTALYKALLRVVRYLGSTIDQALVFDSGLPTSMQFEFKLEKTTVTAFSDSDWAGDHQTRRSVSGGVLYYLGNYFQSFSVIQKTVALSSSEAELMALCENVKAILGAYHLINPIFPMQLPMSVKYDNKGSAFMAANPVNNKRTRHIDTRYKFIHEYIESGTVRLDYVPTANNDADIYTKSTPADIFLPIAGRLMRNEIVTSANTDQRDVASGSGSLSPVAARSGNTDSVAKPVS